MTRILHFSMSPYSSTYGGLEIYLQQLVRWQVAHGHEVCVVSAFYTGESWEVVHKGKEDGAKIVEIHIPLKFGSLHYSKCVAPIREYIRGILEEFHPAICHLHHGFAHECAYICHEMHIPAVYMAHCGEPFCASGMLYRPNNEICDGRCNLFRAAFCRVYNYRYGRVSLAINYLLPDFLRRKLEFKIDDWPFIYFLTTVLHETRYWRNLNYELSLLSLCQAIICPSHSAEALVKKRGLSTQTIVLPHFVPSASPNCAFAVPKDGIIHFYYCGRICGYKGVHKLLEATSKLKHANWELHIIGGVERNGEDVYCQKLMETYPDTRIKWHGKVAHDDLKALISQFHVLVHPALCQEAFGLTIAEALSMGKAVISTKCGGPEDQIVDGVNGWLIPKNDVAALTAKMDAILANPELLAQLLPHQPNATYDDYAQKLHAIYAEAMKQI